MIFFPIRLFWRYWPCKTDSYSKFEFKTPWINFHASYCVLIFCDLRYMNEYFYKFPLKAKIYIHGLYRDLRYMNEYFSKSKVYIHVFYQNLRYIIMHSLACCWRVPGLVSLKYSQPLNMFSNFPYKVYIYRFYWDLRYMIEYFFNFPLQGLHPQILSGP